MIYTLHFIGKFGLWELKINHFRARFYVDRYGADRLVARYRRMLQAETNREVEKFVPRYREVSRG